MKKLIATCLFLVLPLHASAMVKPIFIAADQSTRFSDSSQSTAFERDGAANANPTIGNVASPAAVAGTVSDLTVSLSAAPGTGTSITMTLLKNGVATALTCTVSDTNTTCEDTANDVSVVAGDRLEWRFTPTNLPAVVNVKASAVFETASAETALWGTSRTSVGAGASHYHALYGGSERTTYDAAYVVAPTAFTIDRLYFFAGNSSTSGGDFTTTLYKNGVATALTATVPSGSTASYTATDLSNSVSVSAGDTLAWYTTNNSAGSESARWGVRITPSISGESPVWGSAVLITTSGNRYQQIQGQTTNTSVETNGTLLAPTAFTWRKARAIINPANVSPDVWTVSASLNSVLQSLVVTWGDGSNGSNDPTNSVSVVRNDLIAWLTDPDNTPPTVTDAHFSSVAYIAPSGGTTPVSYVNISGPLNISGMVNIAR